MQTLFSQDVNGDGFDDVMVGGWGASSAAGEILVVFGAEEFSAVVVAGDLDGSRGFLVRGATTSDAAGFDLAAAGVSMNLFFESRGVLCPALGFVGGRFLFFCNAAFVFLLWISRGQGVIPSPHPVYIRAFVFIARKAYYSHTFRRFASS